MRRVRGGPVGGESEMGHGRGQTITRSIEDDYQTELQQLVLSVFIQVQGVVMIGIVTTVTSHPSLVTPALVYSQSRPHPNTP